MNRVTNIISICILVYLAIFSSKGQAADRSIMVQSRVSSTLAGFLPASDYLVIVKKSDFLDDNVSGNSPTGALMKLPGLPVSVDASGKLIKSSDDSQNSYQGPIELTVVLDNNVKKATVDMIQKMLPEIMGSTNDEDSIRVQRATIRQPPVPVPNSPSIVIQNSPPSNNPNNSPIWKDLLSVVALAFVGLGILMWLLGKKDTALAPPNTPQLGVMSPQNEANSSTRGKKFLADSLTVLAETAAEVIALYILELNQKGDPEKLKILLGSLSVPHQKAVLAWYPKWLAPHLHQSWEIGNFEELDEEKTSQLIILIRDLALFENEIKGDSKKRHRIFLERFPVSALATAMAEGYVLSDKSILSLWVLRPESSRTFTNVNFDPDKMPSEISDSEIEVLCLELFSLEKVQKVIALASDTVSKWKIAVSMCRTFDEIDAKLENARSRISSSEYERLIKGTVGWHSLESFNDSQKKDFLRALDVADLVWAQTQTSFLESWSFEALMRPLRFRMYQDAKENKVHESWGVEDVRLAGSRVLACLKNLYDEDKTGDDQSKKLAAA